MSLTKIFKIIDRKLILFIIGILIVLQLFVIVLSDYYTKQAEKNSFKNLLTQQIMLFIQRFQLSSVPVQQEMIKNLRLPNSTTSITPFPEWPIQVKSHALWPIYKELKQQNEFFQLSIRLNSGKWLNIEIPSSPTKLVFRYSLVGFEIGIVICLLGFLVLLFRYSVPLQTIAEAAKKLGMDVNVTPLQSEGSVVVRNTFNAINEMQVKIQDLLRERTLMLAAISHDLRTPLTRLRLRCDLIEDPEQQLKNNRDLDEMDGMINQILAFTKEDYDSYPKAKLDLTALIISLCHDFQDSGYEIKYIGSDERILFLGSAAALKRAFANVMENAIKYAGSAEVNLYVNHEINLIINDQGPGIPVKHIENVFDPFYRVHLSRSRKAGGSGLGLTIARNIIHSHKGTVSLKQNESKGLQVIINLPLFVDN